MTHLLQRLAMSVTGSSRRRRRAMAWGNCEIVEARVVLSAVAAAPVLDTLPVVEVDRQFDETGINDRLQTDSRNATTESNPVDILSEMISQPERSGSQPADLTNSNAVPGPDIGQRPLTDRNAAGPVGDPLEFALLDRVALPSTVGEFVPPLPGTALTALRRPHDPAPAAAPSVDIASDDTTTSEETPTTPQVAPTNEEAPADSSLQDKAAVDQFWRSNSDGFVEVTRPASTPPLPSADSSLLQQESEITWADRSRHNNFSGGRNQTADEVANNDEATAAAIAFFNRQTAGGFVDSAIDDLYGPSGGQTAIATLGSTGLEGSVGRLNPFDDGRHAAILTSVHAQAQEDLHTSQGNDGAASPDIAMAGLAFGLIGVRTRTFSRLWNAAQRLMNRLATVFTGT